MEWTVSFLPDERIVVVKTYGLADENGSIQMAKIISKTMAQHLARLCLVDHSFLDGVSGSVVDVYDRPKGLIRIGVPRGIKIAEIVLPEHRKHFAFLETVCRNRGFDFRIFSDRETAIQWLAK